MEAVTPRVHEYADTIILCMYKILQLKEARLLLLLTKTNDTYADIVLIVVSRILALRHRGLPFCLGVGMIWIQVHE